MNRATYLNSARGQLDLLDARVREAEENLAALEEEARAALRRTVHEAHQKARLARERLERAARSSSEGWADVQRDVDEALVDFRQTASDLYEKLVH